MSISDPPVDSPTDPNIRICRYVDFAKFCSLVHSSTLHFSRLDQMEDDYEGAFSEASFGTVVAFGNDQEERDRHERQKDDYERGVMNFVREVHRKGVFVNCWHMNEVESAAMWKIYSGVGIAIQSTFQRLADSFTDPHESVYISSIKYEAFDELQMAVVPKLLGEESWLEPTLYKRKMFEYERELRAFWLYRPLWNGTIDPRLEEHPTGQALDSDLTTLLERVYISPGHRGWFKRLVQNVLDKYGYGHIPVVSSALDNVPHTRSRRGTNSVE